MSICGWAVTGTAATVLGAATGVDVWRMVQLATQGVVRWPEVFASAMPAVAAVGGLGLLVATLGTVGIFLRLRTASLSEIQLRPGALEEMVASHFELHDQ